ncbi:MAG: hypothetical protein PHH26_00645 [Candidatus Thermoplasmatota archaeon]|nr:hypothetical protein [Candidatus Thermoplasmatota archaeon]
MEYAGNPSLAQAIVAIKQRRREKAIMDALMNGISQKQDLASVLSQQNTQLKGPRGLGGILDGLNPFAPARNMSPFEQSIIASLMGQQLDEPTGIKRNLIQSQIDENMGRAKMYSEGGFGAPVQGYDSEGNVVYYQPKKTGGLAPTGVKAVPKQTNPNFKPLYDEAGTLIGYQDLKNPTNIVSVAKGYTGNKPTPVFTPAHIAQSLGTLRVMKPGSQMDIGNGKTREATRDDAVQYAWQNLSSDGIKLLPTAEKILNENWPEKPTTVGRDWSKTLSSAASGIPIVGAYRLYQAKKKLAEAQKSSTGGAPESNKVQMKSPDGGTYLVDPSEVKESTEHGWELITEPANLESRDMLPQFSPDVVPPLRMANPGGVNPIIIDKGEPGGRTSAGVMANAPWLNVSPGEPGGRTNATQLPASMNVSLAPRPGSVAAAGKEQAGPTIKSAEGGGTPSRGGSKTVGRTGLTTDQLVADTGMWKVISASPIGGFKVMRMGGIPGDLGGAEESIDKIADLFMNDPGRPAGAIGPKLNRQEIQDLVYKAVNQENRATAFRQANLEAVYSRNFGGGEGTLLDDVIAARMRKPPMPNARTMPWTGGDMSDVGPSKLW